MESIIEMVLDLLFESASDENVRHLLPKPVRIVLFTIVVMVNIGIVLGLIALGIILMKDSIAGGIICIVTGVLLGIGSAVKWIKAVRK